MRRRDGVFPVPANGRRPPKRRLPTGLEQAAGRPRRHLGRAVRAEAAPALLVSPDHPCSNPCFNLLCWCNTRAARAVLGAPSFLPLMTRRMQKAQLFTQQGDRGGSCLGIGFQLPAFSCQSLKHFAVCKQFYGDLFFLLSFFSEKHLDHGH